MKQKLFRCLLVFLVLITLLSFTDSVLALENDDIPVLFTHDLHSHLLPSRDEDGVHPVVVCLSHSGTEDGKGEDYEMVKAVNGIV